MWLSANLSQPPASRPAAYVAIQPASGYVGGTPSGPWIDAPNWLMAALDVTWGQDQTPHAVLLVGNASPASAGGSAYYALTAIRYDGSTIKTSAYSAGSAEWVNLYAQTGTVPAGQVPPVPTVSSTTVSGAESTGTVQTMNVEMFVGNNGKPMVGLGSGTLSTATKWETAPTSSAALQGLEEAQSSLQAHGGGGDVQVAGAHGAAIPLSECVPPNVLVLVPQPGSPHDPEGYGTWECVLDPASVSAAVYATIG